MSTIARNNHKWNHATNTCFICGCTREMKEAKILQRTHTYLSRNGIWEDKPIYTYSMKWYYNGSTFERPYCQLEEDPF